MNTGNSAILVSRTSTEYQGRIPSRDKNDRYQIKCVRWVLEKADASLGRKSERSIHQIRLGITIKYPGGIFLQRWDPYRLYSQSFA